MERYVQDLVQCIYSRRGFPHGYEAAANASLTMAWASTWMRCR